LPDAALPGSARDLAPGELGCRGCAGFASFHRRNVITAQRPKRRNVITAPRPKRRGALRRNGAALSVETPPLSSSRAISPFFLASVYE